MIAIMFIAVIAERAAISMRNVALAALFILLMRPESVLNVSFQMSFLAVTGLVALYESRDKARRGWIALRAGDGWLPALTKRSVLYVGGVALSTLVAGLATAPVAAYHFHRVAVLGTAANLVAIPLMGIVIMPMALIGTLMIPFGLDGGPYAIAGWGISVVLKTADSAAAIPGAMRFVPAMPPAALLLFVLGGLWICLWRRPWRWAGAFIVVLGMLVNVITMRPDLLIEQEGKNFVVRTDDGTLVAGNARAARFAVERWLAADGDAAGLSAAAARAGVTCDEAACVAQVRGGLRVAFVKHPSALWDECARADIVVTRFSFRGSCASARLVIDRFALYKYGAHAVYLEDGELVVERVSDRRGKRPWTAAAGGQ
jgi:competence protein ComEC